MSFYTSVTELAYNWVFLAHKLGLCHHTTMWTRKMGTKEDSKAEIFMFLPPTFTFSQSLVTFVHIGVAPSHDRIAAPAKRILAGGGINHLPSMNLEYQMLWMNNVQQSVFHLQVTQYFQILNMCMVLMYILCSHILPRYSTLSFLKKDKYLVWKRRRN